MISQGKCGVLREVVYAKGEGALTAQCTGQHSVAATTA